MLVPDGSPKNVMHQFPLQKH